MNIPLHKRVKNFVKFFTHVSGSISVSKETEMEKNQRNKTFYDISLESLVFS